MSNERRSRRPWLWLLAGILISAAGLSAYRGIQLYRELNARLICAGNLKAFGTGLVTNTTGSQLLAAPCPCGTGKYRSVPNVPPGQLANPAGTIIALEPLANHGGKGANVLYADGHTQFLTPDEFRRQCAAQGIPLTEQAP